MKTKNTIALASVSLAATAVLFGLSACDRKSSRPPLFPIPERTVFMISVPNASTLANNVRYPLSLVSQMEGSPASSVVEANGEYAAGPKAALAMLNNAAITASILGSSPDPAPALELLTVYGMMMSGAAPAPSELPAALREQLRTSADQFVSQQMAVVVTVENATPNLTSMVEGAATPAAQSFMSFVKSMASDEVMATATVDAPSIVKDKEDTKITVRASFAEPEQTPHKKGELYVYIDDQIRAANWDLWAYIKSVNHADPSLKQDVPASSPLSKKIAEWSKEASGNLTEPFASAFGVSVKEDRILFSQATAVPDSMKAMDGYSSWVKNQQLSYPSSPDMVATLVWSLSPSSPLPQSQAKQAADMLSAGLLVGLASSPALGAVLAENMRPDGSFDEQAVVNDLEKKRAQVTPVIESFLQSLGRQAGLAYWGDKSTAVAWFDLSSIEKFQEALTQTVKTGAELAGIPEVPPLLSVKESSSKDMTMWGPAMPGPKEINDVTFALASKPSPRLWAGISQAAVDQMASQKFAGSVSALAYAEVNLDRLFTVVENTPIGKVEDFRTNPLLKWARSLEKVSMKANSSDKQDLICLELKVGKDKE